MRVYDRYAALGESRYHVYALKLVGIHVTTFGLPTLVRFCTLYVAYGYLPPKNPN